MLSPISAPAPVKAPLQPEPVPDSPFPPRSHGEVLGPGTELPDVSRWWGLTDGTSREP